MVVRIFEVVFVQIGSIFEVAFWGHLVFLEADFQIPNPVSYRPEHGILTQRGVKNIRAYQLIVTEGLQKIIQ